MKTGRAFFLALLIIAVLLLTGILPYEAILVTGDSMEPTLKQGDLALVEETEVAEEGDIIVFYSGEAGTRIAHRVVDVTEQGLITQGDNNAITDQEEGIPPVQREEVQGAVVMIGDDPAHIPIGVAAGSILEQFDLVAAFLTVLGLSYYFLSKQKPRGREHISEVREVVHALIIIGFVSIILMITIGSTSVPISVLYAEDPPEGQPAVVEVGSGSTDIDVLVRTNSPPAAYRFVDVQGNMQLQGIEGRDGNQFVADIRVDSRATAGAQVGQVRVYHYPKILPRSVVAVLHAIHPLFATVGISAIAVLPAVVYYLVLLDPKKLVRADRRDRR